MEIKAPDGKMYKTRSVEYEIRKEAAGIYDTENGVTVRVRATVNRIRIAIDGNGQPVKLPNGDILCMVENQVTIIAEPGAE